MSLAKFMAMAKEAGMVMKEMPGKLAKRGFKGVTEDLAEGAGKIGKDALEGIQTNKGKLLAGAAGGASAVGLSKLLGDDDGDEDDGSALEKYRKRKKSELC
jgi:hypothetical protein